MGETYCFHHKSLFMQFLPFEGNSLALYMLVYYQINNHILSIWHFDWASFEGVLAFYDKEQEGAMFFFIQKSNFD